MMSKSIYGTFECPVDGIFTWKGYILTNGLKNFHQLKWNEDILNFRHAEFYNNKLKIYLICPKCKKEYLDLREKNNN